MQFSKQAAIVTALLLLLSACSTVKLDESAPVEDRTGKPVPQITTLPPYPGDPGLGAGSNANTTASSSKDPLDDPASILAKRSIYFDLDSYVVKDEYKPVI